MSEAAVGDDPLIPVNTRFHAMILRPGGIPRERAIEAAEARLQKLHSGFLQWLDSELAELAKAIPHEISDISSDDRWIHPAYDHCRAIRDVAATMGFHMLTFAANGLCEIFETIRSGVEYPFDAIESDIQTLLLARLEADNSGQLQQLRDVLDRFARQFDHQGDRDPARRNQGNEQA